MDSFTDAHIVTMAVKSLLYEVSLSPKPGLVDRFNTGAHHDMDLTLFIDSSLSLIPYFEAYLEAGNRHHGPLPLLFDRARVIGVDAEKGMFEATNGTNTHKGANFSFALVLVALGYYRGQTEKRGLLTATDSQKVLTLIKEMCHDCVMADFASIDQTKKLSYGEKLYCEYGLTGIRGEAASGYQTLQDLLLPALRGYITQFGQEEAFLRALVLLMSEVEDGNIIHRGGIKAWETIKEECLTVTVQNLATEEFYQWLTDYDQELIKRHLSPGGSADLLALGYFFMQLEGLI
ncbi:triphosphoribosyl-dephospho-CoA synthase [Streptococcus moroccensis]|uniref:Probable 2-(5''-triphosphoribosyl)-3'-dephosphocoenzyme-A synthase n=1 Tax=Streptococcus moroccensis TaxID=1451356 RepID=A0ABT9YRE5_9STRE|nr:triphosphoribosyl-dephospho-CoA synthase [Streptococcus moroccensis]